MSAAPMILGPEPSVVTCPTCQATAPTVVRFVPGTLTWIGCLCLGWGCCCIPFLLDCMKDAEHSCGNCNAPVGRYRRI